MKDHTTNTPFLTGSWSENLSWGLYLADELPSDAICTAVCCIAVASIDPPRVVLTRNHRGWELIAGHVEPGETVEAALVRECQEEGGFTPSKYTLLGYRRVTAKVPEANDHHGGFYPLVTYIPQYIATTTDDIVAHTGEEILESAIFDPQALPADLERSQVVLIAEVVKRLQADELFR
jgi:8-oxo-dGTP pyrophosphatase MutT (NUDIX family)